MDEPPLETSPKVKSNGLSPANRVKLCVITFPLVGIA